MSRAFIGIGSNEGDRLALISRAAQLLAVRDDLRVIQMALVRETDPVGGPLQDRYLNTVVEVDTTLEPLALLRLMQAVERQLGRQPAVQRWGPRPIDLDLLFYEDHIITDPALTVPHPRLHERRFVLEPLAELAPGFLHPVLHEAISQLLEKALNSSVI